jgi:hypothetical protein
MQKLVLLITLTLCLHSVKAQDRLDYVAVGYTPGFLLAHRADIKHLASHNFGLELSYEKNTSNTDWGSYYNKPTVGYSLLYYNIGNSITGHGIGGFMNVKFNLFSLGKTETKFRMGAGLGYLTEKFDIQDNRRNQAIGSNLNGSMQFAFLFHTDIKKWNSYAEYGIGISHYSNAAYRMPNLGYNMPAFFFRYGVGVSREENTKQRNSLDSLRNWRLATTLVYSKKQRNFSNPVDISIKGVQVKAIKSSNEIRAWRFGLDAMLDKSYKYTEDPTLNLDEVSVIDQLELGLAAGYQWSFGSIDAYGEVGAYVYKPAVLKNPLYQRMGVIYNLTDKVKMQGALKFHKGVADYFETGITYHFTK